MWLVIAIVCSAHFGAANTSVPIWLDEVECVGTERSIVNCLHSNWTAHDCHHHEDAGVACTSEYVYVVCNITWCECVVSESLCVCCSIVQS